MSSIGVAFAEAAVAVGADLVVLIRLKQRCVVVVAVVVSAKGNERIVVADVVVEEQPFEVQQTYDGSAAEVVQVRILSMDSAAVCWVWLFSSVEFCLGQPW